MHPEFNDPRLLRELLCGMRAAYARGENVMAWARQTLGQEANTALAILIAYDLQTGTYTAGAEEKPEERARWCGQVAALLEPWVKEGSSLLEVGCGEATTLAGVLRALPCRPRRALGFDISWSRCLQGRQWLRRHDVEAELFVADLFRIPLADSSIDVVYTSHSLEPNGGREEEALRELMRVARRAVVLVEPMHELAGPAARARMEQHGYVRDLHGTAKRLGFTVRRHELLGFSLRELNPSGVLLLEKTAAGQHRGGAPEPAWQCPLTQTSLRRDAEALFSAAAGLAYPVLRGIPLLHQAHAIVASAYERAAELDADRAPVRQTVAAPAPVAMA